ncbi:hypothetical protein [Nocardia sp. NBC_00403]|uniref:hypothetical protein n=1 Tax=Nocardia sp. NBC_00403 TaxID=2975990 RepID=UPI002E21428E
MTGHVIRVTGVGPVRESNQDNPDDSKLAEVIQNAVFPNQNIQDAEKWPRPERSKISLAWAACSGDRI